MACLLFMCKEPCLPDLALQQHSSHRYITQPAHQQMKSEHVCSLLLWGDLMACQHGMSQLSLCSCFMFVCACTCCHLCRCKGYIHALYCEHCSCKPSYQWTWCQRPRMNQEVQHEADLQCGFVTHVRIQKDKRHPRGATCSEDM